MPLYHRISHKIFVSISTMILLFFMLASSFMPSISFASTASTTVIVHYHRFAGDYAGWNLWLWPYQPNNLAGASYNFNGTDSFGEVATAQVPGNNSQVGVIVRLNNWAAKDVSQDRHIQVTNGKAEIWLIQGDPTIYYSKAAALANVKPAITAAYLDSAKTITVGMNAPASLTQTQFTVTDQTTGSSIPVVQVTPLSATSNDVVALTLAKAPSVQDSLTVNASGYTGLSVTPRDVLNSPAYTYQPNNLGSSWSAKATTFRVWAPTATRLTLLLYKTATGSLDQEIAMNPGPQGTYQVTVPGNLQGYYYLYQVTIDNQTQTTVDPFAQAIAPGDTRSMVVNLAATNPPGFTNDHFQQVKNPVDAVIYEVNVRDFSIDKNGGFKNPGKYLAFTEQHTVGPDHVSTGVASLKQLGVNYVQLMPVQEFPDPGYAYNWGYITRQFDTPEGMFATTPVGTARITQLKQLVQSLHQNHIGVIMDVVYNHTFAINGSAFNTLVPGYFWRTDNQGNVYNGSGVGNEVAAERPMVKNFILDSLLYWVKQYHIDGFRFDLMALLGTSTMKEISQQLHAIDPHIILYGEPWTGGQSGLPSSQLLTKGQQQNLGIGVFNDNLRNAIEGNVFNVTQQGFAMGGTGFTSAIKNGVVGSIPYSATIQDFAANPSETINYVTSHDNYTLWDKLKQSNPTASTSLRIRMDELAQAIVMTSQGVAFMQGGEEMLRTKGGNGNSYNAGDTVNQFDWSRKVKYASVFNYYANLIHLREAHPAFRMTSAAQIRTHLQFLPSAAHTVEFELSDHANGDSWKNIIVIYNPGSPQRFTLPQGTWHIVGTANLISTHALATVTGQLTVPNITTEILYQA